MKIHSFRHNLACFRNRMPQTRPDFVLMLRFYHDFSITSLTKISCIFGMLKMQRIFIIELYLHSHYWTKMSNTFTFNRTELVPVCQNKAQNFYTKFSTDSFLLRYSPDLTPSNFFLWEHLKNKIFAIPPATTEKLKRCITMEIQNIIQKTLRRFSKIWCAALLPIKISIECIFSICYSL